jgi:hypothetical protein
MKTLQVLFNGQEVGTRKTERNYTWALVAHSFREAEYRERMAKAKYASRHYTPEYLDKVCARSHAPAVISYHHDAELAHKAAGAKRLDYLCCSISVVPVQVKAAKARKTRPATEPSGVCG